MRYLGIDYGSKRIGLAVSDETGTIATPLIVIKNDASALDKVIAEVESKEIKTIILGESKDQAGNDNPIMVGIMKFKETLEKRGVEVDFEKEYFTSAHVGGNRKDLDASAAALILQRYLDRKKYGDHR